MLDPRLRTRYLVVLALRWIPLGLLLPIFVVLMLEQGLGFGAIGIALACQSLAALAAEIPSGMAADRWGQRRILLIGSAVRMMALTLLLSADTLSLFAVAWTLEGFSRAMDSGCLDSWYVNSQPAERDQGEIGRTFALGGTVIGLSIAGGSGLTAVLGALSVGHQSSVLAPVLAALIVQSAHLILTATTIQQPDIEASQAAPETVQAAQPWPGARSVMVPGLALLFAAEMAWGFGMTSVEILWQPVLAGEGSEAITSSDVTLLGVVGLLGWCASAAGAAILVLPGVWKMDRRLVALSTRVVQALLVVAFALLEPKPWLVLSYILIYLMHGASNPAHLALLHEQATDDTRSTAASFNSFAAQIGGTAGALALPTVAAVSSLTTALLLGAAVIGMSAAGYIPHRSHGWRRRPHSGYRRSAATESVP